jgi:hypothetical protein
MRALLTALLPAALLLTTIGCDRTPQPTAPAVPAGVAVVENPARHRSAATWQLGDSILRDIGGLHESNVSEFEHSNGHLSAVRLSDGGLAVADFVRVRLFHPDGRHRVTVGRAGYGPGEFASIEEICRADGDTLVVFDNRRITIVSPEGAVVRQSLLPDMAMDGAGCFFDGTLIAQQSTRLLSPDVHEAVAVRRRDDGLVLDTLGTFPRYGFRGVSQYVRLRAHGRHFYLSDPRFSEVRRFRMDGTPDLVVRTADRVRRMDAASASRWLESGSPSAGSGVTAGPPPAARSPTWPFYRGIRIDGSQRLWVQDFPADDAAPERWTAYDSTGRQLGSLDLPRGVPQRMGTARDGSPDMTPGERPTLIDAYGDHVILLEFDAMGAAHFRTRRFR